MIISLTSPITLVSYIEVLKPRETSLLVLIGCCSAFIASVGHFSIQILSITFLAILLGSAGCNGLTNYLDREVDSRMPRTCNRVLPSRRIYPPQKVLPLIIILILVSLILAWFLNPLCFLFGLFGVIASAIWRKTISCTFLGIIAGCSPVLVGWFAFQPVFNINILMICILVALWIPIHVWSIMIARREEYFQAGLRYFPLNLNMKNVIKIIFILSLALYVCSLLTYFITTFHLIYLITANLLGIVIIYATSRLLFSPGSKMSWRVYKISSFPYLGILFLAMCLDILLL